MFRQIRKCLKGRLKHCFYLLLSLFLLGIFTFAIGVALNPFSCELIEKLPHAKLISDRQGEVFWASVSKEDSWQVPVTLAEMSPNIRKAIIAAEDARFYDHSGIDPYSVVRAALKSVLARRITSGASTLSMQVVKMAHLRQKSAKYKFVQMCEAVSLEQQRSKDWVLERYLNMAPFGGNIIGIEAASRYYFHKSASDLTVYEASLLAGLPQSPSRLRPDRYPERARRRQLYVLQQLRDRGYISGYEFPEIYSKPILGGGLSRIGYPQENKEISELLEAEGRLQTTIDLSLQLKMRQLVETHLKEFDDIKNASLVILDNKTSEILALIGHTGNSQVNTVFSKRSSGSVLKPFIYLSRINQGMLTAASKIDDKALHFDDYNVRNFSGDFQGEVSVQKALTSSLNTPAVKLLSENGVEGFLGSLKQLGFSTLDRAAEDYGLSLALGGAEVNLIELVNAYACLANKGVFRPWKLAADDFTNSKRVYDAGATEVLNKMLRSESLGAGTQDRLCWKTGTSNGFRDAWCVGYNHELTIGVWLGNNNGTASRSLIGAVAAAPLVAKAFKAVYPKRLPLYEADEGLDEKQVCAKSGLKPVKNCVAKVFTSCSKSISLAPCREHLYETASKDSNELFILSPEPGNYSCLDELRLQLKSNKESSWFINGKYLGRGERWQNFSKGNYEIRCVRGLNAKSVLVSIH